MLKGLFYEEVGYDEASAIKAASIYFDQVFVLTPVSLMNVNDPVVDEKEVQRQLYEQFKEVLGPKLTDLEIEMNSSTISTLRFQENARDLINNGVISIVNPFDEMKSLNLRSEFADVINESIKDETAVVTKHHDNKGMMCGMPVRGAIFSEPGGFNGDLYLLDEPEISLSQSWQANVAERIKRNGARSSNQNRNLLFKIPRHTLRKILIKSALLVSKKQNAFPVSTNEYADDRLWKDATRSLNALSKEEYQELKYKLSESRSIRSFFILKETIAQNLPDFSGVSFSDIIEVRVKFNDELVALRNYLYKLASTIENEVDVEKLPYIIEDIVKREVNPAINDLERKIKAAKRKTPFRMLDKVALTSTSSLAATAVANIPIYYSPLFAAIILAAVATSETYREIVDMRTTSAMSFLMRLKK